MKDEIRIYQSVTEVSTEIDDAITNVNIAVESEVKTRPIPIGTSDIVEKEKESEASSWNIRISPRPIFKQWKGEIVSIEDSNLFLARIYELNDPRRSKLVRFDKRKVSFENASYFAEGASFVWKVGLFYENGTAYKRSRIRFRILPPPNPILVQEARDEIAHLFDMISWTE